MLKQIVIHADKGRRQRTVPCLTDKGRRQRTVPCLTDDATGVGVADDAALIPLMEYIRQGLNMIIR